MSSYRRPLRWRACRANSALDSLRSCQGNPFRRPSLLFASSYGLPFGRIEVSYREPWARATVSLSSRSRARPR